MRRSSCYLGAAAFVALALAMPLAALEPVAGGRDAVQAGAYGAKLATICESARA
jgi:hypothetical protein